MKSRALTAEQDGEVTRWRTMALQRMPYFASILFALRYVDTPGLGTFAVDPQFRCYIDFDAVRPFGPVWCSEALLHEASHVFMDHAGRAKDLGIVANGQFTDPAAKKRSNYASDAEINDDLLAAGCAEIGGSGDGPGGVLPAHLGLLDHETYEFYYRNMPSHAGGDASPDDPYQGCGSGGGGGAAPCELGDDDLDGAATPADDGEKDRIGIATATAISNAAKMRGDVPAGLVGRAESVLKPPQVRWNDFLRALVKRATQPRRGDTDQSYSRPHRRRSIQVGSGTLVTPGPITYSPTIAVVRDTSGSMGESDLARVSAEVEGISRQLGISGDQLRVLDVDAAAYEARGYRGASTLSTVTGGGGTDMRVGVEAAAQLKPTPHVCVVITDGYTPWPDAPPVKMKVVACIVASESDRASVVRGVPSWMAHVCVDPA